MYLLLRFTRISLGGCSDCDRAIINRVGDELTDRKFAHQLSHDFASGRAELLENTPFDRSITLGHPTRANEPINELRRDDLMQSERGEPFLRIERRHILGCWHQLTTAEAHSGSSRGGSLSLVDCTAQSRRG